MVEYKVQNYDATTGKTTITNLEQSKIDEIKEYYSDAKVNERKLNQIRNIRNEKLSETDYLAMSDNTMSDEMKTYRKNMRDIPQDYSADKYDELLSRDSDGKLTHSVWTKPS